MTMKSGHQEYARRVLYKREELHAYNILLVGFSENAGTDVVKLWGCADPMHVVVRNALRITIDHRAKVHACQHIAVG